MDESVILAVQTRNCVRMLNVTYYFSKSVSEEDLILFGNFDVHINRFSKTVAEAKDHFKLTSPKSIISINGAIGGKSIEVTFGKFLGNKVDVSMIRTEFEMRLLEKLFGSHFVYHSVESEKNQGA